ncbi:hypothetical protein WHR41_03166 [Cladosporium halotolerans]|uniref:CENP-V/GFA domain-containing protein n=1 Tax=Cladosporium halotolerans TaxID=1052096 RepID=A0AB34KW21_9PEZI
MPTNGRCLCGDVKVQITTPISTLSSLVCHCANCKRRSGGVASYAFMVPKEHASITGDNHVNHSDPNTSSGKPMQRSMCSRCGSPVRIIEGHAPDVWCLQYGLFADEVELPRPKLELFRSKACGWVAEVGEDVKETQ